MFRIGLKTGFSSKPITLTSDTRRISFRFLGELTGFLKSFLLEGTSFSTLGNEFRRFTGGISPGLLTGETGFSYGDLFRFFFKSGKDFCDVVTGNFDFFGIFSGDGLEPDDFFFSGDRGFLLGLRDVLAYGTPFSISRFSVIFLKSLNRSLVLKAENQY